MLRTREIDVTRLAMESVEFVPGQNRKLVLMCEHAGSSVPEEWSDLGLQKDFLCTHFGCDLGARDLALALARSLDAPLIAARYSRLFFDINRQVGDWEQMRPDMGGIPIPGNQNILHSELELRDQITREPFDAMVRAALAEREMLVSLHTFSPIYDGASRKTDIGILHLDSCPLGEALLASFAGTGLIVGDNEPYDMRISPPGAIQRLVPNAEKPAVAVEVRNDLLTDSTRIERIADIMRHVIASCLDTLERSHG